MGGMTRTQGFYRNSHLLLSLLWFCFTYLCDVRPKNHLIRQMGILFIHKSLKSANLGGNTVYAALVVLVLNQHNEEITESIFLKKQAYYIGSAGLSYVGRLKALC